VAEYSAAPLHGGKGKTTFYLVRPGGRKYPFYVTPTATAYPKLTLVDWSGDRRRILVYSAIGDQPYLVEQISLVTRTVVSRFRLPSQTELDGYTRPYGAAILAVTLDKPGIDRYSLTGHLQRVLAPRTLLLFPNALESRSGAFLVVASRNQVLQVSSAGRVTRRVRLPGAEICGSARWWTASTALVRCYGNPPYNTERLWLVPLHGRSPRPLTAAIRPHGGFNGYDDAWQLGSDVYLQGDSGPDETLTVIRQGHGLVTVPGPGGVSPAILTANAGQLLLWSNIGGPGGPSSLFWFNPGTGAEHFLFRAPAGVYGVAGAIPYGYWN
jgi:hypothetical protein